MMKIERKFEVVTETKRRYIIRQTKSDKQTACAECGEPMLAIAQAAILLGMTLIQWIEKTRVGLELH